MWRYDATAIENLSLQNLDGQPDKLANRLASLPADIESALDKLITRIRSGDNRINFSLTRPLFGARAPGRLDVMGGIADYSGSTVLQLPIQESTIVFCQHNDKPVFSVVSQSTDTDVAALEFCMPMSDFLDQGGTPHTDYQMHQYFVEQAREQQWAAYVAGVVTVLMQQFPCDVINDRGILLYVSSTVPSGKGVSSSAALEVAVMRAICALLQLDISAHQQAVLCQRVENRIVGAPCGLMDQMASSCAEEGALLNMLCQPDIINEPVSLPAGLSLWGIDSGLRHAVSGADYSSVRIAAFMGYRYILETAGIADSNMAAADINDYRWRGYLANVSVSDYLQWFEKSLPERVSGREFLQRFDATTDAITSVNPHVVYAVRACTAHPVHEHFRARLFIQLAKTAQQVLDPEALANLMGECMYQSHASYSSCGLDSHGTDDLVSRLKAIGSEGGIYGARITGGGSGGVVAVLARADADDVIRAIASDYAAASGIGGYVFSGSSSGAMVVCLMPSLES
ncbi:MAG: hypothetical protein AB8B97_15260 [Granulosicoccus sp.]